MERLIPARGRRALTSLAPLALSCFTRAHAWLNLRGDKNVARVRRGGGVMEALDKRRLEEEGKGEEVRAAKVSKAPGETGLKVAFEVRGIRQCKIKNNQFNRSPATNQPRLRLEAAACSRTS